MKTEVCWLGKKTSRSTCLGFYILKRAKMYAYSKYLYNGMDANTFVMSNTRHFLLLALCSLVLLVLVLVFKIFKSLSFHVRFVGFVVHVLRAVFHHELSASFDVDE